MSQHWYRSSIGKKVLMALSGLILTGFVIMHLLGNLLIYQGPAALNAYAHKLRELGALLWVARISLLGAVGVHVWAAIAIAHENRRARPQPYAFHRMDETTYAARTMVVTGILLLAYVAYHLLHFTFRVTNPEISRAVDSLGRPDVYAMVVLSFQQPLIAFAYVIGMAALCFHLGHGIASTCQTLGLNTERAIPVVRRIGWFIAAALLLGYSSIPLAVLLGVVRIRA